MTLICIECCARFESLDQARLHTNRRVSKDNTATMPLKKHVVFPASPQKTSTS